MGLSRPQGHIFSQKQSFPPPKNGSGGKGLSRPQGRIFSQKQSLAQKNGRGREPILLESQIFWNLRFLEAPFDGLYRPSKAMLKSFKGPLEGFSKASRSFYKVFSDWCRMVSGLVRIIKLNAQDLRFTNAHPRSFLHVHQQVAKQSL